MKAQFTGPGEVHTMSAENREATFFVRDLPFMDLIVVDEVWDENVYELSSAHVAGKTVIDVGANIGAFTVFAMKHYAARVVAFEPDVENAKILWRNVAANQEGMDCAVNVYASAVVGNGAGDSTYLHRTGTGGGNWTDDKPGADSKLVSTWTLDDVIMSTEGLAGGSVGLLKIDCEGCEYDVVLGTSLEALSRVERIVMETHPTESVRWGLMMYHLASLFSIHYFGDPEVGGQIVATRYGV